VPQVLCSLPAYASLMFWSIPVDLVHYVMLLVADEAHMAKFLDIGAPIFSSV
jgi:hypothetical protein